MSAIPQNGLVALTWVLASADVLLTIGRYVIRKRTLNGLDWDDLTHGLAVCALVGYAATYTAAFPLDYQIKTWAEESAAAAAEGNPDPPPPSEATLDLYVRLIVVVAFPFWVCVYLVKLSFLLFYRRLFGVSQAFMRAWWIVLAFTALTFLANFLAVFWSCDTPDQLFVLETCISPASQFSGAKVMIVWCALNVASHLSIMILPLWMLHTLQMRTTQKLALAGLFLLGLVDIVFDILRTLHSVDGGKIVLDPIWDILEPTVAVLISCLPTYYSAIRRGGATASRKKPYTVYKSSVYPIRDLNKHKDGSGQYPSSDLSQHDRVKTQISVKTGASGRESV